MECVCLEGDGVILGVGLKEQESRKASVGLGSEGSRFEPKGWAFALPKYLTARSRYIQDAPDGVVASQPWCQGIQRRSRLAVSGAICTVFSCMVAGLASLDDSKHHVAGVIVTGMIDAVFARSWSAEKHAVWNCRCRKMLSIQLCS